MRKFCLFFTVLTMLFVVSCGPSKEEWKAKLREVEELKSRIERLRAEYEKKIGDLKAENEKMQAQLSELTKARASLEDLVKELNQKQTLARQRLSMLKDMLSKFKSLIAAGKLKVKIRKGKMVLELPSAVLFPSGKAMLSEEGMETLAAVAPVLASIKGREFQVAGHTDNVPIKKKKFPSNWELSAARAISVVKFLQSHGVPPESLSAAGYSQYQPVADNSTLDGKAANRRIEIILMPNLEELPDLSDLEKIL